MNKTLCLAALVLTAGLNSFGANNMSAGDFAKDTNLPKEQYPIEETAALIPESFDEKYITRVYNRKR